MIDTDGGGVISAEEFYTAMHDDDDVAPAQMTYYCFQQSLFELADAWADEVSEASSAVGGLSL